MQNDTLIAFLQYQYNVHREEYEYSKYTDLVQIDHTLRLICFYIWLENSKGNNPTQTDIIYALGIPHSTVRKHIKNLIKIKYLKETTCSKDARFARYEATKILNEGMKVHVARHMKTLFVMCKKMIVREDVASFFTMIEDAITKELGSYNQYDAYGEFTINQLNEIVENMYGKETPPIIALNNSAIK